MYALLPPCKRWDKLKNKKLWTAWRLKPSVWLTLLVPIGPTTQTCAVVSYNINSAVIAVTAVPGLRTTTAGFGAATPVMPIRKFTWDVGALFDVKATSRFAKGSRSRAKMQKETDRIEKYWKANTDGKAQSMGQTAWWQTWGDVKFMDHTETPRNTVDVQKHPKATNFETTKVLASDLSSDPLHSAPPNLGCWKVSAAPFQVKLFTSAVFSVMPVVTCGHLWSYQYDDNDTSWFDSICLTLVPPGDFLRMAKRRNRSSWRSTCRGTGRPVRCVADSVWNCHKLRSSPSWHRSEKGDVKPTVMGICLRDEDIRILYIHIHIYIYIMYHIIYIYIYI